MTAKCASGSGRGLGLANWPVNELGTQTATKANFPTRCQPRKQVCQSPTYNDAYFEFENIFYISYLSLPPLRFHPGKTFADILPAAQRLQLLESLATVIHKKHHLPSIGWFPQIVDTRNQKETWPKASGLPVEFPSPPVIAWHMWTRLVVPVKRSKPRGPVLLEHFSTLSSYHQPLPQSDQPRAGVLRLGEGEVHRVRQAHCKPPRWAAWPAGRARCCRGSGGGWRWAPRSLTETGYLFS